MNSSQNKTALITGASRNIGRAIAISLGRSGYNLSLVARSNSEQLEVTLNQVQKFGVKAHSCLADLSTDQGCDKILQQTIKQFSKIDVLIHTVAIRPHKAFEKLSRLDWIKTRSTILDSTINLTLGVIPHMLKHEFGRIVFFTGVGTYIGSKERAHVSAAKMGIVGLSRSLANEYASRNIRINIISPGKIDTERDNPEWYTNAPITTKSIPMGRLGTTEEIAAIANFLVDDASNFVTGQTLHVNGGEFFG